MPVYENVPIDDLFARNYEIEWLIDMPNSTKIKRYEFGNGPIFRIEPADGEKFIVTVPGEVSTLKLSTWPNADSFFVLPSAWLVNTANPDATQAMPGFEGHTVHYVWPLPDQGVVLLGHCCGIYCYDAEGLRWEREDLFCCEDPVMDLAGDTLVLLAHKHGEDPGETPVRKLLSLKTGQSQSTE